MDDSFNDKIQKVFSDPDSLKTIMSIASALGGKNKENIDAEIEAPGNNTLVQTSPEKQELSRDENSAVAASASHTSMLSSDDRVNLLLSIKPFLNNRKQQRVDSLVKALGAARLISAYKDTDLFGSLGFK